ncbi:Syntaxin-11 [Apostichopus japonicus]|uniref:Syntaxin-11 n=1 Tax=Stichopus japonicus TaxID=307972 RepID=A0A2G8KAP3_STIJA|nr:Syntaxin-11 [Apostichopus japonicus]
MTQQLQKQAKVKREKDYEVLLQQKEQLDHIESSVKDVHEITLHVSRLVEEQGHHIDNIEADVRETKYAVYAASEYVNKTVKYKASIPPTFV